MSNRERFDLCFHPFSQVRANMVAVFMFLCKKHFTPQHERVTVARCKATFSQVSFAFLAFLSCAIMSDCFIFKVDSIRRFSKTHSFSRKEHMSD